MDEDDIPFEVFNVREDERLHRHMDGMDCNADGAVCMVTSSLSGRDWDGCLWVYAAPFGLEERQESERTCAASTACHHFSTGLSDVVWVGESVIAATCDSGSLAVFQFDTQNSVIEPKSLYPMHHGLALCVAAAAPSGETASRSVLTGGADGRVVRWDLEHGKAVEDVRAHAAPVVQLAPANTHSALVATCSPGDRTLLWDMRSNHTRPCSVLPVSAMGSAAAFSPDDTLIALGNMNGEVSVHDMRALSQTAVNYRHGNGAVDRLTFAPHHPTYLASCGESVLGYVMDVGNNAAVRTVAATSPTQQARDVAWSAAGVLFSCGHDYDLLCARL